MLLHLLYDAAIAFKSKHGSQLLLSGGEAKRTATYVVCTLTCQPLDVFKRVGRTADDKFLTEQRARLTDRHIVFAKMYAIGLQPFSQFHAVVQQEYGLMLTAQRLYLCRSLSHFLVGSTLHAQLNPFASALKSHACTVNIAVTVVAVGYELYLFHACSLSVGISFCGLKKWFTGPCPCPMLTSAPTAMAADT